MSHSKNHVTDNRLNRCFTIHQEGFSPIPTKEDGGGGRWWGTGGGKVVGNGGGDQLIQTIGKEREQIHAGITIY